MISRQDIENEAAFIQHLIKATNPTGGDHTPTPWHKTPADGVKDKAVAFYHGMLQSIGIEEKWSQRAISAADGHVLAFFLHPEDRDLALYFTNIHAGTIAMLRGFAGTFEFLARNAGDEVARSLATSAAENARIYAGLLSRLGKVEEGNEPAAQG